MASQFPPSTPPIDANPQSRQYYVGLIAAIIFGIAILFMVERLHENRHSHSRSATTVTNEEIEAGEEHRQELEEYLQRILKFHEDAINPLMTFQSVYANVQRGTLFNP